MTCGYPVRWIAGRKGPGVLHWHGGPEGPGGLAGGDDVSTRWLARAVCRQTWPLLLRMPRPWGVEGKRRQPAASVERQEFPSRTAQRQVQLDAVVRSETRPGLCPPDCGNPACAPRPSRRISRTSSCMDLLCSAARTRRRVFTSSVEIADRDAAAIVSAYSEVVATVGSCIDCECNHADGGRARRSTGSPEVVCGFSSDQSLDHAVDWLV